MEKFWNLLIGWPYLVVSFIGLARRLNSFEFQTRNKRLIEELIAKRTVVSKSMMLVKFKNKHGNLIEIDLRKI